MSRKLKSIFLKKIDRDIDGVIKAGHSDEANVKQELEEFVVTEEIKVHIDRFFQGYKESILEVTENNGVWISGFFGSGKSHFLKVLSYILKNEKICGKSVVSYFKGKGLKKSTLDNMKKAEAVSTDVILFNIASKVEQSNEQESLLKVFDKTFNEMRGLCGSKPWVAAMEEQMISEGVYENFKGIFKEISNKPWEESRENFYFEKDFIVKALVKAVNISEEAAREWCDKSESAFTLNVEKFALKVSEYCKSRSHNHHVIFLIDEIGQYMGKDTKLMLNLQTIVEELGVKCEGKCWVIVTAQENLNTFVNEENRDFSKILGRFNIKMSLSSSNADEVIKKRLLKKNKKSEVYLKSYFEENESNIKNLIMFPKESGLKGYKDSDDFVETYPFVPYEFNLLQLILKGIAAGGAAGKDISRGERSLLEFYQNTAVNLSDKTIGNIIPLYAFYSEIEIYLNSSVKEVMLEAKKNKSLDDFNLRVLKTLFLLKYVKVLKSDAENVSTFLISRLDESKKEVKDKTEAALTQLVSHGLIEKTRKGYVFLTKEEQLINKEIEGISLEREEINEKIGDLVFHSIYKDIKYNYSPQYKFSFNKYVDNRIIGAKRSEIGIRIITSAFEINGVKESELKRLSECEKEVIVDISDNMLCVEVVEKLLKIDSYLKRNHDTKLYEALENSYIRKMEERDELTLEAEGLLNEALRKSKIFVSSNQLSQGEKNGIEKINEGLNCLINAEYFKLNYVQNFIDEAEELQGILSEKENLRVSVGELALGEVKSFIEGNALRGNQVSLNHIVSRFRKMPYGWKEIHIQGILLELIKNNRIKGFYKDSLRNGDKNTINHCIINKISGDEILFKAKVKVPSKYLEVFMDLTKELFNTAIDINDSEKAMIDFKELCKDELYIINHMLYNLNNERLYPGKNVLNLGREIFREAIEQKEELKFYKEICEAEQDFQEYIDEIEEVKKFYFKNNNGKADVLERGDQRIIFDKAVAALENFKENEDFVEDNSIFEIMVQIEEILFNKKPYSLIQRLPELLKEYEEKYDPIVNSEVRHVEAYCSQCRQKIINLIHGEDLGLKSKVEEVYEKIELKISREVNLAKLAAFEKLIERKTWNFENQINK